VGDETIVTTNFLTKITLIFGVILIGHSALSAAAPVPESVSGAMENGDTLTVEGRNFTVLREDTISIFDTVDNQEAYSGLGHGTGVPENQGLWASNGSPWAEDIIIARQGDNRHPNSSASFEGRRKGYLGVPRAFSDSKNPNLYVSWWFKPNSDPNENDGHNKFIRIWDDLSGDFTRISWTQILLGAFEAADGNGAPSYGGWGGDIGKWNRLEIYANSENGTIEAWTNGRIIHSVPDYQKETDGTGLTIKLIGFDPNYGDRYSSLVFRMDDVYVSSSPARVELSSSSTWSNAGKDKELQPYVRWGNNSIDFKLSYGQLDPKANLYLYIVDNNGNVNRNGMSLCPLCPNSPDLLKLE
jgi:hypothetical protein